MAVTLGTLLVWQWLGIHDQDGGGYMALGLVIGPFFALVGGIVGAILFAMLALRRRRNAPPASTDDNRRDMHRFIIIGGAIAGGIIGHYAAQLGLWFASPIRFDSYWKVWAISWIPTMVALLGALAGGLFVRRVMPR
jgi:hypothetical protein